MLPDYLQSIRTDAPKYENRLLLYCREVSIGGERFYQFEGDSVGERVFEFYESKKGQLRDIFVLLPPNFDKRRVREKLLGGIKNSMQALESFGMKGSKDYRGFEILLKLNENPVEVDGMIGMAVEDRNYVIDFCGANPERAEITPTMLSEGLLENGFLNRKFQTLPRM